MKVGITMDPQLMERADVYAKGHYLTRSGLIAHALNTYLNSVEMIDYMRDLTVLMRKIADNNAVDEETLTQLQDLERVAAMFGRSPL